MNFILLSIIFAHWNKTYTFKDLLQISPFLDYNGYPDADAWNESVQTWNLPRTSNKLQEWEWSNPAYNCETRWNLGTPLQTRDKTITEKTVATLFSDEDGVIHFDFLKHWTTINSVHYITMLQTLKWLRRRVWKEMGNVLLQCSNAKTHTSCATRAELQKLNSTNIWNSSCSQHLAQPHFHLFLKMKDLWGQHYAFYEEFKRLLWKKCVHSSTMASKNSYTVDRIVSNLPVIR